MYVKTTFLPLNKIKNMFKSIKDHLDPLQDKGVYKKIYVNVTYYIYGFAHHRQSKDRVWYNVSG